jgi:hypothetical protein
MKKKIESYLPIFSGFCRTHLEYANEEYEVGAYNDENGTEYDYSDFHWDYQERNLRIANDCCFKISEALEDLVDIDVKIKFQQLVSPREYNFSNDSINCEYEITQHEYDKVIDYLKVHWTAFEKHIRETYSSRDGFISSHSSYAEVWMNNMKSESHLEHNFGSVLNFILLNEEYTDYDLYESLSDDYVSFELIE